MHYSRFTLLAILFGFVQIAEGQYQNTRLFQNDSSFVLLGKLINEYKPSIVLDYSQARIKMYTQIYNEKDTVRCVYTKHSLYLDPSSSDPIGYLIKNGNANGINCEHTYPQSKGAEFGNAHSDMHHLFPSRAAVNSARSNYPFGEIKDDHTNEWYYKSFVLTSTPQNEIEEYSESIDNYFEPREDHKGNVARAVFYFITMYESQADKAFFEGMRPTLCKWHLDDPVDSLEWHRSQMIAIYQDQKANPFVLDCSLARRCYCSSNPACLISADEKIVFDPGFEIFPNPAFGQLNIRLKEFKENISIQISDVLGQPILSSVLTSNHRSFSMDIEKLKPGMYILEVWSDDKRLGWSKFLIR